MTAAAPEPTLEGKIVLMLAERLDRHLSERDFEQGCRLACGYDGDDRSEHIAADLAAVLAPLVVEVRERAVEEALEAAAVDVGEAWSLSCSLCTTQSRARIASWLRDRAAARIVRAGGRP